MRHRKPLATLTGLEPATSAVTGRRANQLRHRALLNYLRGPRCRVPRRRTPYGIRTRATALKGRRPRPLDEGGRFSVGSRLSLGHRSRNSQIAWSGCISREMTPFGHHTRFRRERHRQFHPDRQRSVARQTCKLTSCVGHSVEAPAPIAQLVELRTFNPQVVGSSPTGGTRYREALATPAFR